MRHSPERKCCAESTMQRERRLFAERRQEINTAPTAEREEKNIVRKGVSGFESFSSPTNTSQRLFFFFFSFFLSFVLTDRPYFQKRASFSRMLKWLAEVNAINRARGDAQRAHSIPSALKNDLFFSFLFFPRRPAIERTLPDQRPPARMRFFVRDAA